ncbi:MAG: MAE_28990/MAE_18760 family HEPN-like nuclease, partial [Pigmentiphaga sp.]
YNLVEATIIGCLDAVSRAAATNDRWSPGDLSVEVRREWVRHVAKTNVEMTSEKRLHEAIMLCDHLVAALPVKSFDIEKGGGGNWDDCEIYRIAKRIGCPLKISPKVSKGVKHVIKNDKGAMALVVSLRNGLAHGNLSFVECSQDDSVANLSDLTGRVEAYLREVVTTFSSYIENYQYLRPECRPAANALAE